MLKLIGKSRDMFSQDKVLIELSREILIMHSHVVNLYTDVPKTCNRLCFPDLMQRRTSEKNGNFS